MLVYTTVIKEIKKKHNNNNTIISTNLHNVKLKKNYINLVWCVYIHHRLSQKVIELLLKMYTTSTTQRYIFSSL